jgi:hypothetical protein
MKIFDDHKINTRIKPGRMKFRGDFYTLLDCSDRFIIKGYRVRERQGKIFSVWVRGHHPNANPKTKELCLPDNLRTLPFNEVSKKMIENQIYTYNLDDCYFTPWDEIVYKKQIVAGAGEYGKRK